MALTYLLLLLSVSLVLYNKIRDYSRRRGVRLPPGPPSDPIIGHLRVLPRHNQEVLFLEWSKIYGDVFQLNVLGKSIIVLSSETAVTDLLEKRSAIYSDRPWFPFFELVGWKESLVFLPYGEKFHKMRKLFQQHLTRTKCLLFQDIQTAQAHILLKNLLRSPEDFEAHGRLFTSSVVMEIAYGHHIESKDDVYIKIAEKINNIVAGVGNPGATAVDLFPILRFCPVWFPGAWFIRYGRDNKPVLDDMERFGFEDVTRKMAAGTAEVSFLSMRLEELNREGRESEEELNRLKVAAADFYAAGGETTWSSIQNFFLFMLLHPHAQRKAQKEIDDVLGQNRLPQFSDRKSLPYVDCTLQETLRWHSAVPLGIPHRVMEDDIYRGMFIPKGSTIIANVRGIFMDEKVYSNPQVFYPERYLAKPDGNGEPFPTSAFGFGRRICPGRHLAEASLWIAIAMILATFDILPFMDERGEEMLPEAQFTSSLTCHAKPFRCIIRPRSEKTKTIVMSL